MRRRCGTIVNSEIQSSRVQEWQTLLLREFEPRPCHRCCRLAPVAIDSESISLWRGDRASLRATQPAPSHLVGSLNGSRPIWINIPNVSASPQCSTIPPSETRSRLIPRSVMHFPEGSTPSHDPRWVPVAVTRDATQSPSATTSWICMAKSGNVFRIPRRWVSTAIGPRGAPAGEL